MMLTQVLGKRCKCVRFLLTELGSCISTSWDQTFTLQDAATDPPALYGFDFDRSPDSPELAFTAVFVSGLISGLRGVDALTVTVL